RKISFKIIHSTTHLLPNWREQVDGTEFEGQTIPRDVATRWNSTFDMLIAFLKMKQPIMAFLDRSTNRVYDLLLEDDEWNAIEGLVSALKILKEATSLFSMSSTRVAAVIPAMDTIDEAFASGIIDDETLSTPVRHALSIGKWTMNRYYELSDDSYVYRIAMSTFSFILLLYWPHKNFSVLDPSLKLDYFKNANWPQLWIDSAVTVTREVWEHTFKPTTAQTASNTPTTPEVSVFFATY
ncbi:hypothetical protein EV360DRAFT_57004, partial [Lentinula raphanica]